MYEILKSLDFIGFQDFEGFQKFQDFRRFQGFLGILQDFKLRVRDFKLRVQDFSLVADPRPKTSIATRENKKINLLKLLISHRSLKSEALPHYRDESLAMR